MGSKLIQDGLNEELENMIDFSDRGQFQEREKFMDCNQR